MQHFTRVSVLENWNMIPVDRPLLVWMMSATRYQASSSFHDAYFAAIGDGMKPPVVTSHQRKPPTIAAEDFPAASKISTGCATACPALADAFEYTDAAAEMGLKWGGMLPTCRMLLGTCMKIWGNESFFSFDHVLLWNLLLRFLACIVGRRFA